MSAHHTRRGFLHLTGSALGGSWLAAQLPAIEGAVLYARQAAGRGQSFQTLAAPEAALLEAMAARVFPTDDTPGAREAGVVYFMDRSLGSFFGWMLEPLRDGLAGVEAHVADAYPGSSGFAELPEDGQDAVLGWFASEGDPNAFFLFQVLCSCGMFGSPDLGGNRAGVGWELIGFEPPRRWAPPFGHYDAEASRSGGQP